MVAWIWAKLSYFICEYLHNTSCKFYRNSCCGSRDTAV